MLLIVMGADSSSMGLYGEKSSHCIYCRDVSVTWMYTALALGTRAKKVNFV